MTRAAILTTPDQPLAVGDIQLRPLGTHDVRVTVESVGVCHSDLSLSNGSLAQALPAVLGHEGAGTVAAVGSDVDTVRPGDRVVLNWSPACRHCWFCTHDEPWLCENAAQNGATPYATLADGTPVYAGLGTAAFAEETVVPDHAVVTLPDGISFDRAALLGCAGLTGFGAVRYTAGVRRDDAVVVVGLGGVGLSVVQAAHLAGASAIIAVDRVTTKKELAEQHGATTFLTSGPETSREIRALTGDRGADHAFDCVGRPETIRAAWSASRRGGTITVVGIGRKDMTVEFNALELNWFARTIRGCVFGSTDPDRDLPLLANEVAAGDFDPLTLVSGTVELPDINEAFRAMAAGEGGRVLVRPTR